MIVTIKTMKFALSLRNDLSVITALSFRRVRLLKALHINPGIQLYKNLRESSLALCVYYKLAGLRDILNEGYHRAIDAFLSGMGRPKHSHTVKYSHLIQIVL